MESIITIRRLESHGYYWHCSRPERPGDQSDYFPTISETIADARQEYPDVPISNIIQD